MTADTRSTQLSALSASTADEPTFDQRWAAWQIKGAAQDARVRRRIAVLGPAAIAAAVILYTVFGR